MKQLQRVKSRFADLPMTGKLAFLMIVASFIPMLVVTFFSYRQTYNAMLEKTRESMLLSAQSSSRQIERQLDSYYQILSSLYTDNTLRAYLTEHYESDYDFVVAYQYIDQLMYSTIASTDGIKHIKLYVDNDTLPKDGFFVHGYEQKQEAQPWLSDGSAHTNSVIVSPVVTDESGSAVVCFGQMLDYHQQGYAYAYLVMEVWADHLTALLQDLGDACLLDDEGRLIGITEGSVAAAQIAQTWQKDLSPAWQESRVQDSAYLAVQTMLTRKWQVVHAAPLSGVIRQVRENTAGILIIWLVCTLASLAVIGMIIRYFTGRIRVIMQQISRLESKDYSIAGSVSGRDELARVSQALNSMAQGMQSAITEVKQKEKQRRHMQLSLLQSQINPHFLYNSLAGVSALALRNGDEDAHQMVSHLAQFYKLSLNKGKDMLSLADEIQIARHYLILQNIRFRGRFVVSWEIDEAQLDCTVPKLILQPFIENIVDHALRPEQDALQVIIRVCREEDDLCLMIEDNGIGIDPQRLASILEAPRSTGYGIRNVADRLKLLYGENGRLHIASAVGHGTCVTLRMPRIHHAAETMQA